MEENINKLIDIKISQKERDEAARQCCLFTEGIYMVTIVSLCGDICNVDEEVDNLLSAHTEIMYKRNLDFSLKGLRNLLMQLYDGYNWIGDIDNHFEGIRQKLRKIDRNESAVKLLLIRTKDHKPLKDLETEIQQLYQERALVKITKTSQETRDAGELFFNAHSIHHLNHATPDKYKGSFKLAEEFKNIIHEHQLDSSRYVVDSSMIMAMYGIREATDLDYYTVDEDHDFVANCALKKGTMEYHDRYLKYHSLAEKELILTPPTYYIFRGVKYLSLDEIILFKKNRGSLKDKNDIELIRAFLDERTIGKLKVRVLRLKHTVLSLYAKIRTWLFKSMVDLLKKARLYDIIRDIKKRYS